MVEVTVRPGNGFIPIAGNGIAFYADFRVSIAYSRQVRELQDRVWEEQGSFAPKKCLTTHFHDQVGKIISEMYVRNKVAKKTAIPQAQVAAIMAKTEYRKAFRTPKRRI